MRRIHEAVKAMRWSQIGIACLFLIPAVAVIPLEGPWAASVGLIASVAAMRVFFVEFMACYEKAGK